MPRVVLVDTNLLLLLVLGGVNRDHIERWNRTRQYSVEDYDLLCEALETFDQVVVTPHVLTETGNLLGQLREPLRRRCLGTLAGLVSAWREQWAEAATLVQEEVYLRLGLTDSAIYQIAAEEVTVLTDDLDLYRAVSDSERRTINFTHLRAERGLV